jgi:glycosyltransferase involved in cell wall biosynthesis
LKISIITTAFNSEDTILDTVKSVRAQRYKNVEHIVVDGASTDGTLENLRGAINRVDHLISEPDDGIYDGMNKGIALATGDIIGILNSDDVYYDDSVLDRVSKVFSDPGIDICYGDLVYVRKNNLEHIVRYWKSEDYLLGSFERGWMPPHPTVFIRKSVYEKYGNFDLNFPIQGDFELMIRFLEVIKLKAVHLPHILVKMRIGGVSNRSTIRSYIANNESYYACLKHGLKIQNRHIFILRKMLSRVPQFFIRPKL